LRQRDAEAAARKNFSVDQAKTPKDKAELAKSLLRSAPVSGPKEVEFWALLRLARILAAQGNDVKTALEAVDRMASAFEVDAMGEKVDLFAKATPKGPEAAAWALVALDVATEASEANDFDSAVKLAARAESLARVANDKGIQKTAEDRVKELGELRRMVDSIKPHFKMLESDPNDPAANAAAGKFICLMKEDWQRGLPMMAKGSDPALKSLAELELGNPSDAAAQAALGEAWAGQADKETSTYKARARERAAEWFSRALPGLAGAAKAAVEKKLSSLGPKTTSRVRLTLDLGGGAKMEFISIRPGTFTMGGTWPPEAQWTPDERPEHRVTISKGFFLGRVDVTRGQFAAFVKASGYKTDAEKSGSSWGRPAAGGWEDLRGVNWQNANYPQTDDHPVVCVSWNDAKAFCDWTAKQTGRAARLPTEAEWEYACRAGSRGTWSFGDQESALGDYGWFVQNSGVQTHPVGQKRPNPWGLHDMHGNVWQWCQDWVSSYTGDAVDPAGPSTGQYHSIRGGSFGSPPVGCRSSIRLMDGPTGRSTIVGFRVALSP
jgi:formylglycine-generating enzyme required for sulfatase activity